MVCVGLSERDLLRLTSRGKFWGGHWGRQAKFWGGSGPPWHPLAPPLPSTHSWLTSGSPCVAIVGHLATVFKKVAALSQTDVCRRFCYIALSNKNSMSFGLKP